MAAINYTPADTFPDLDGTGRLGSSGGPLQFPQDGDPFTFEVNFVGGGGTANSHGLMGKIMNALFYLAKRIKPFAVTSAVEGSFAFDTSVSPQTLIIPGSATVIANHIVTLPLLGLQHGTTLASVAVTIHPDAHGALPGTMPFVQVKKTSIVTGATTQIGATTVDSSANTAAYDVQHAITVSGLAEVIDRTLFAYAVFFVAETGANSDNNTVFVGVQSTFAPS
jgi:hypothetical protein